MENPQHFDTRPFYSPKLTVWIAVWKESFIGPFFFKETVSAASYLKKLKDRLATTNGIVDLREGALYFMQDDAPPHWHRDVRAWLNEHFAERWTGRSGSILWPARSPDFSP